MIRLTSPAYCYALRQPKPACVFADNPRLPITTWAQWADEIRERVDRELLRAGIFPPGRYFHERSR